MDTEDPVKERIYNTCIKRVVFAYLEQSGHCRLLCTGQAPHKWSIAFGTEVPKPQVYPRLEQNPENDLQ